MPFHFHNSRDNGMTELDSYCPLSSRAVDVSPESCGMQRASSKMPAVGGAGAIAGIRKMNGLGRWGSSEKISGAEKSSLPGPEIAGSDVPVRAG